MGVFLLFLLALSAGTLSTLFWVPEAELERGYFQTNALVTLGLLGLAAAVLLLNPLPVFAGTAEWGRVSFWAALIGAFAYYGAIWRRRWKIGRWAAALALSACTGALLAAAPGLLHALTPLPHRELLLQVSLVGSALVLGWSLATMLLGHWYLISPKLSFRHLVRFCWALLAVIALRAIILGATLVVAHGVEAMVEPHPWRMLVSISGQGMFFWFRVLWGLAMPLTLGGMALHCARNRSNQSATGILYVLLMGSLVGEITALYITLSTGVPV